MFYQTIALAILFCIGPCNACLQTPNARSLAGIFSGSILTSLHNLKPYAAFRGIPYAKPPVEELRFAKPVPFPRIEGAYNATDFGPICIQPANQPDRGQEDCLSLNVYTPLCKKGSNDETKLNKVLVFIHGGGLVIGSSKDYLPGDLVTKGDVVVVTLNYRLGWLGYLRGNTDSLPGNQFLWDVLLALNWVKDNIPGFHGDPDDVTLSGESAGSVTAAVLSISPLAKDLFSRAILMSGALMNLPTPPTTSNDFLRVAATELGCDKDETHADQDPSKSDQYDPIETDSIAKCLQSLPASAFDTKYDLRFAINAVSSGDDIIPRSMAALVSDPGYLLNAGFFTRDYVLSVTKDDGYVLVNSDLVKVDTSSVEKAERAAATLLGKPESSGKEILDPYRDLYNGDNDKALIALFTDAFFISGNVEFVRLFTNPPDQPASDLGKAFLMSFDHDPHYISNSTMLHALDLSYLFDLEPAWLLKLLYSTIKRRGEFSVEDIKLKELFIDVMADFIKTREPSLTLSRNHGITWLPVQKDSNKYLSFSARPTMKDDILQRQGLGRADYQKQEEQAIREGVADNDEL